jgi:hypothetical protein
MLCQPDFTSDNPVTMLPWFDPPFAVPSVLTGLGTPPHQRTPGEVTDLQKSRFRSTPIGVRSPRSSGGSPHASPRTPRRPQPRCTPIGRHMPPYTWRWISSRTTMASTTLALKVNHPPPRGGYLSSSPGDYNKSSITLYPTTLWT